MPAPSRPRPRFRPGTRRRRAGFTLLEILVSIMIFLGMVSMALWMMASAEDQALASERARQLRMLAEYKLGEISIFERRFDQNDEGDFSDLPEDMRELYREWRWRLDVRDVTAFEGKTVDPNAPLLFPDASSSSTSTDAGSGSGSGSGGTSGTSGTEGTGKGESQILRELVLTVTAPSDTGEGEGDSIEIVTFLPQVATKAAAPAAGAGGTK